jgi:hypothetical protein
MMLVRMAHATTLTSPDTGCGRLRRSLPRNIIERLPRLRMIASTGPSDDQSALIRSASVMEYEIGVSRSLT